MDNVIIIGGGISGLIAAIRLARQSFNVQVIEKHTYPRHKVCGEYVSREAEFFLKIEKLLPPDKELPLIDRLQISSSKGNITQLPLPMGGIGISRYLWEKYLFNEAKNHNVEFIFDAVTDLKKEEKTFNVFTRNGKIYTSNLLIGAYGKRSIIDKRLNRSFFKRKSPYVGIKFHALDLSHPENLIALHNFPGGYCGVSRVEDSLLNFCYLCHREVFREAGNIQKVENLVLSSNPVLAEALSSAKMTFEKPLVINEISFETKSPVEEGIPMIGDAAGMITPLCGNGMAMAVYSAKLLTDVIINDRKSPLEEVNETYTKRWNVNFRHRLAWGRIIQSAFFGKPWASSAAIGIGNTFPSLANFLVRKTHGNYI